MSDPNRQTVHQAEMIDSHIRQPMNGQIVWAVGRGGCAVQTTWNSKSIEFYEAWHPCLKLPQTVKDRMRDYYKPKNEGSTSQDNQGAI